MTDHVQAQRHKLNESATLDDTTRRRASLTLAGKARGTTRAARDAAELTTWLDMLGLPPCERKLRSATKWKGKR